MKIEYKTVDVSTIKGIEAAERLQATGWLMGRSGLFTIQFYRKAVR